MKKSFAAAALTAVVMYTAPVSAADMQAQPSTDGTYVKMRHPHGMAVKAECLPSTRVTTARELLAATELGEAAVGPSDVGFFAPTTKPVREVTVTAESSVTADCRVVGFHSQTSLTLRHVEGPGILSAVATGVGIAAGGALNGALTRPAITTITNAGSTALSSAAGGSAAGGVGIGGAGGAGGAGGKAISNSNSKSYSNANANAKADANAKLNANITNNNTFKPTNVNNNTFKPTNVNNNTFKPTNNNTNINKPTFNNKVVQNPNGGYTKNGKPCDSQGNYLQGKNGKYSFVVRPGYNFG